MAGALFGLSACPVFAAGDGGGSIPNVLVVLIASIVLVGGACALMWRRRLDATEAARVQSRFDAQEQRFLFALEATQEGWWDWNAGNGDVSASARACEIFGLGDQAATIPFRTWVERLHSDDRILVKDAMGRHLAHGVPYDVTYRVVRPDGLTRWVRSRGRAMRDASGRVCGVSGFIADITEARLAQAAEAELAARHTSVLAALPDLMFELDDSLVFTRYHAPHASELALPPEEFLGRKVDQVLPPRVAFQFHDACARLRVGSAVESMEYHLDTLGADNVHFEGRMVRIRTGGFLCIIRNITERKEQEVEIRRHRDNLAELVAEQTIDLLLSKDAAERARRQQADFLTSLSHELREPLHAILGFAQMADRKARRGEGVMEYCTRVEQSAHRMLAMVADLLDVSRAELTAGPLRLEAVSWRRVCEEVVRESAPMLSAKRLRTQVTDTDEVGPVRADEQRLRQVVEHLLINAIKFSPSNGLIALRLVAVPDDSAHAKGAVMLELIDEGIGLEMEDPQRLFEPFPRHDVIDGDTLSAGLGLAVCRQHVQAFGGRIEAENRPQGGALFRVVLPAMAVADAAEELES